MTPEELDTIATTPKRVTNAAGETVEARSADEVIKFDQYTSAKRRTKPFIGTRSIPPGTTGPEDD